MPHQWRLRDVLPVGLGNPPVAMLHGYYDGSADQPTTVHAVGGFIAHQDAWDRLFHPAWRNILNREGLDFFHMTDAVNHVISPYDQWSPEHGNAVLAEMVTVIRRTVLAAVCVSLVMEDYRTYEERLFRIVKRPFKPYALCAAVAVEGVRQWQIEHGRGVVRHFFEAGDEGHGQLIVAMENMALEWPELFAQPKKWAFEDKREILPLQAADIMAYETMLAESRKPPGGYVSWEQHRVIAERLLSGSSIQSIERTIDAAFMQKMLDAHAARHGLRVV